ncbi:hypothetical protein QJQ45_015613 [Haematococcus lacustris]|nr:hypothetical protein QJQ45_015613 [Haematococcus lacustris]
MACGYGINAHSSELQAAHLDKAHVADLIEEADMHRCLLGMEEGDSLQDILPLPCRMRHAVHVCRWLEQWQQPRSPPLPGQSKHAGRRDTVKRSAEQVIQGWQAQLTASYQSLKMLAVVVETFPNWDDLLVHMPPFAVAALASISDVYPKNPISLAALGLDLMALGSKGMSELIISTRQIEFQGPLMLYEGYEAILCKIPVFIRNVSEGELFGRPRDIANCTNCYNATTREKFWVSAALTLFDTGQHTQLLWQRGGPLALGHHAGRVGPSEEGKCRALGPPSKAAATATQLHPPCLPTLPAQPALCHPMPCRAVSVLHVHLLLEQAGYSYQLLRQGGYLSFDTPADPSGNFLVVDTTLNSTGLPKDPLHIPMELELPGKWVLLVGYPGGWQNRERQAGLLALVVVMSCLLSTLLLVMLVNNHRYRALLEAVLPSSLVQQMADKATLKQLALGNGHHMHARTPADCILDMMGEVLGGRLPSIKDVMMVRTTLMQSVTAAAIALQAINIYQPIDIIGSIKRGNMDADVAAALSNLVGQGGAVEERSISAVSSPLMRSKSGVPDPAAWDPDCSTLGTTLRALMAAEPAGLQCTTSSARQELEQLALLHTQPSLSSLGAWDDVEQPGTGPGSAAAYSIGPATVMVGLLSDPVAPSQASPLQRNTSAGEPTASTTCSTLADSMLLEAQPLAPLPAADRKARAISPVPHSPYMLPAAASLDQVSIQMRLAGSSPSPSASKSGAKLLRRRASVENLAGGGLPALAKELAQHLPAARPATPLYDEVDRLLGIARESWKFDVRQLDVATAGHPLSTLTYYLLHSTGLLDELGINKTRMARFLRSIEAAYLPNPYHGQRHVTEVVQGFHIILTQSGMQPLYADPLTQLACYLAAAVHDLDHKGVTNDFLVSSHHQLALLYNDRSPMENHHLTLAFTIMRQPGCHFMHGLPRADQVKLRKSSPRLQVMIDQVLATDMRSHFAIRSQFATMHRLGSLSPAAQAAAAAAGVALQKEGAVQGQLSTPGSLCVAPLDDTERALSLQVALKLADLSQLARSLDLHLYWVACLEEECFLQGDLEKAMNLAVSPLFDRSKPGITKSQVGFFEVLVIPLFHSFCSVFTAARPFLMDGLMRNYQVSCWLGVGGSLGLVSAHGDVWCRVHMSCGVELPLLLLLPMWISAHGANGSNAAMAAAAAACVALQHWKNMAAGVPPGP